MKFLRKKTARPVPLRPSVDGPAAEQGFYSRRAGEAPLDEYSDLSDLRQTRRTSRHSPARRRENSNRASRRAIFLLMVRTVLWIALCALLLLGLVFALSFLTKPSEKKRKQWEERASRMNRVEPVPTAVAVAPKAAPAADTTPEALRLRLDRWDVAERHTRSAEALIRRGIDAEAEQRLQQALASAPEHREAQKLLAELYVRQNRSADAALFYIRLLDQESGEEELRMALLKALRDGGQIESALVLTQRILDKRPEDVVVLEIAAGGEAALGRTESALELFERVLNIDEGNRSALKGCATIHFDRGAFSNAVPFYLELIRLYPEPDFYQKLACCYAQQNQAGKSVVVMGQAASLFGEAAVSPWLRELQLDPVRESDEFRSFADRVVGVETRKAIEALSRRAAEQPAEAVGGGLALPKPDESLLLRPSN
jgi:tetratricopeptide (TPR) repeat protein